MRISPARTGGYLNSPDPNCNTAQTGRARAAGMCFGLVFWQSPIRIEYFKKQKQIPQSSKIIYELPILHILSRIDDIDTLILSELANDSSISIPKLSSKINVNTSVVYSRIRRLQSRGLIRRFTIEVNNAALGYTVKVLAGIKMDTKKRNHIMQELFNIDGVFEVAEVTGRFDILVTAYAKSLESMHRMVSEKIGRIDGVLSSESFIEMKSRQKAMPYMASGGAT